MLELTHPKILTHPNIPKPLHGVNPRTIEGDAWWNKTRQAVYASTEYHCKACGVHKKDARKHQWLEAHEYWDINYKTATCTITEIVPLCHFCHNFIHSGRLTALWNAGRISDELVRDILEHGFGVLMLAGLKCFEGTYQLARMVGADTYGVWPYLLPTDEAEWGDWKLIWCGKEYRSPFGSYSEWEAYYDKKNEE